MRFISTKVHGIMDYTMGLLLVALPWLLGFAHGGPETWVPVLLGAGAIFYSILTRYELGLIKVLPMPVHLTLDLMSGALLAASPWVFGFDHIVSTPHLLLGLVEIAASLTTQTRPAWEVRALPQ